MSEMIDADLQQRVCERQPRFVLDVAAATEREEIYRIRHEVYARELGQHTVNDEERLTDLLDGQNIYLTAKCDGRLAGL